MRDPLLQLYPARQLSRDEPHTGSIDGTRLNTLSTLDVSVGADASDNLGVSINALQSLVVAVYP